MRILIKSKQTDSMHHPYKRLRKRKISSSPEFEDESDSYLSSDSDSDCRDDYILSSDSEHSSTKKRKHHKLFDLDEEDIQYYFCTMTQKEASEELGVCPLTLSSKIDEIRGERTYWPSAYDKLKHLTVTNFKPYLKLTQEEACEKLGVGLTSFKQKFNELKDQLGLKRWPRRRRNIKTKRLWNLNKNTIQPYLKMTQKQASNVLGVKKRTLRNMYKKLKDEFDLGPWPTHFPLKRNKQCSSEDSEKF